MRRDFVFCVTAVIELEVVSSVQREKIEAVIDTGFTGYLMLPRDLINHLNLPLKRLPHCYRENHYAINVTLIDR